MRPWLNSRAGGWWLAACLLLACALRFAALGRQPLWLDEATSVEFAKRDLRGAIFAEAAHPPLYYLLLQLALRVLPDSDAAVRLPSAVFGLLGVALMWPVARRLAGGGAAAAGRAVALAAASPYLVYLSQEARSYALVIFLSLAATLAYLRFLDSRSTRDLLCYAALSLALLYTHYFAAFVLLSHEAAYWLDSRARPRAWMAARLAAGAAFLPWVLWAARSLDMGSAEWIRPLHWTLPLTLLRYVAGYGIAPPNAARLLDPLPVILREEGPAVLLAALPLLALMMAGAQATWSARRRETAGGGATRPAARVLLAAMLLVPVLALAGLSAWRPLLHDRNLAFQQPFALLLIAAGIGSLQGRARKAAGAACAAAMAFSLWAYFAAPGSALGYPLRFAKAAWPDAAAYVAAERPDAVVFAPHFVRIAFQRYWKNADAARPAVFFAAGESGELPDPQLAPRIAVVASHTGPPDEAWLASLSQTWSIEAERVFPAGAGIRVKILRAKKF
jgi:4-amino-4-deoxy-L-arabinose transferase-like glycosyltransferase